MKKVVLVEKLDTENGPEFGTSNANQEYPPENAFSISDPLNGGGIGEFFPAFTYPSEYENMKNKKSIFMGNVNSESLTVFNPPADVTDEDGNALSPVVLHHNLHIRPTHRYQSDYIYYYRIETEIASVSSQIKSITVKVPQDGGGYTLRQIDVPQVQTQAVWTGWVKQLPDTSSALDVSDSLFGTYLWTDENSVGHLYHVPDETIGDVLTLSKGCAGELKARVIHNGDSTPQVINPKTIVIDGKEWIQFTYLQETDNDINKFWMLKSDLDKMEKSDVYIDRLAILVSEWEPRYEEWNGETYVADPRGTPKTFQKVIVVSESTGTNGYLYHYVIPDANNTVNDILSGGDLTALDTSLVADEQDIFFAKTLTGHEALMIDDDANAETEPTTNPAPIHLYFAHDGSTRPAFVILEGDDTIYEVVSIDTVMRDLMHTQK